MWDRIPDTTNIVTPLCTQLVWFSAAACCPATSNTTLAALLIANFQILKPLSRCVSAGPHGLTLTWVGSAQHTETTGLCQPKGKGVLPVWNPRVGLWEELSSLGWFLAAESCLQNKTRVIAYILCNAMNKSSHLTLYKNVQTMYGWTYYYHLFCGVYHL